MPHCSHLFVEVTSTWLPIPFANLTLISWHGRTWACYWLKPQGIWEKDRWVKNFATVLLFSRNKCKESEHVSLFSFLDREAKEANLPMCHLATCELRKWWIKRRILRQDVLLDFRHPTLTLGDDCIFVSRCKWREGARWRRNRRTPLWRFTGGPRLIRKRKKWKSWESSISNWVHRSSFMWFLPTFGLNGTHLYSSLGDILLPSNLIFKSQRLNIWLINVPPRVHLSIPRPAPAISKHTPKYTRVKVPHTQDKHTQLSSFA